MCGISVCISENRKIDIVRFDAMTDIVSHRGPDDRGTYYDGDLALGHRRLSIIDLSHDGHQPFELIDGYVLVFNGEIYNYLELREELIAEGYQIKSQSDTEIIVHSYKRWGSECTSHFNGMWSFALYDKEKQVLFCSRDRFGVKPFYYTKQEGMFLAASEIKQFFEMLEGKPRANEDRLLRYIIRGETDMPPYTLFEDIYQLEPGSNLIYDLSSHEYQINRYYDLDSREDGSLPYEDACSLFRNCFTDSVRVRLRSDVPVGYFLSGGLDSSSIVCVADRLRHEEGAPGKTPEQHTITSCYDDKKYDEQEYVDEVAAVTDVTVHKVFPDNEDIWQKIDNILWHMDEPVFGLSALSQRTVCEAAKKHGITVVLDGQGSDEQLAGYSDFYSVLFIDLLKKFSFGKLRREIDAYKGLRSDDQFSPSRSSLVISALKDWMTPGFLDKAFKRLYYERVSGLPFDRKLLKKVFRDIAVLPRRNPRKYIKEYMTGELANILHTLDRNSMAFSLEARDPFLDYRLVETIYKMPFSYKIRDGRTKAVLRDGLSGIIPEKIKNRRTKLAFVAPVEKWINEDRTLYRRELDKALDKFDDKIDKGRVLSWYDSKEHLKLGECNLVWRIIVSGRWVDLFDVKV